MSRVDSSRGPGIRVPPPFIYLGAWLVAWAANMWLPLPIDPAGGGPVQAGVGWLLVTVGFSLLVWGLATLVRASTTFFPDREANRLVVAGPYRFSRNPAYVGMTGVYAGVGLLANQAWPFILLPFALIAVRRMVVDREERYLAGKFGRDYEDYCRRVRRWF